MVVNFLVEIQHAPEPSSLEAPMAVICLTLIRGCGKFDESFYSFRWSQDLLVGENNVDMFF